MWVVHFIGGPWDGRVKEYIAPGKNIAVPLDPGWDTNQETGELVKFDQFTYKLRHAGKKHIFAAPHDWDSEHLAMALLDAYAELKGEHTDKGAG